MDAATEDPSCLAIITVAHLLRMFVRPLPPDKKKKKKSESGQIKTPTHRNWDRTSQPKHGENPSNATGWGKKMPWLFPGRLAGAGVAIAAAGTNEYEASETSDSDFYRDQPMEWNMTHVV